tara:strand:- start:194 stop:430 length:237 start_codon:yes stop_codon:yes gene_type:complete
MDGEIKMTAVNDVIEILKRVDIDQYTMEYILKELKFQQHLGILKNEVYSANGKYFRNEKDAFEEGRRTNYAVITYNLY